MARLHVVYPNGYEQTFKITKSLTRVGRHSVNDLQLTDEAVSRFHAEIVRRKGHYILRDLRSRNGVFVNDVMVGEHVLTDGDTIQIGNIRLHFHLDEKEPSPETEHVRFVEAGEQEDQSGPIVQTKRPMNESTVLAGDLSSLSGSSREQVQNRLRSLAALCRQLLSANSCQDLLEEAMDQIARHLPFDRGCIMLTEGEQRRLVPRVVRDNRKQQEPGAKIAVSMTIAETCMRERSGVLCTDAVRDTRFSASDSIRKLELHSVICVPLIGSEGPLGIIHLESRADRYAFTNVDLDYLLSMASELSVGLEHMEMRESRLRHDRLDLIGQTMAGLSQLMAKILDENRQIAERIEKALAEGDVGVARSAWQVARNNNARLARLADDMILYAKARPGKPTKANVNEVVERAVAEIDPAAKVRGVAVEFRPDQNVADGYFDPEALKQVLTNLLRFEIQSVGASEQPSVVILSEASSGGTTSVLIQDNGPGAEIDMLEPLALTTDGASGLELAIAQKLVLEMGGKIECQSERGLGTTFVISIPTPSQPPAELTRPDQRELGPATDEDLDAIG